MNPLLLKHFVVCAILALVSVPLILKRVPPNRLYGVRTVKTLGDSATWYKVNWFGGWAILIAAVIAALNLVIAGLYLPTWTSFAGLLIVAPLIVALVAIWLYSMRISDVPAKE